MHRLITLLCAVLVTVSCAGSDPMGGIRREINGYLSDKDVTAGVAVITASGDTMTINEDVRYPMMSVFKFHQALALADDFSRRGKSFDTLVHIVKEDVSLDTWSPMRDKYPQGNVDLSVRELLAYTLVQSDNLACDVLFRHFVTPSQTEDFVRSAVDGQVSIKYDEAQMFHDNALSCGNWTTPLSAARLMEAFVCRDLVPEPYRCELLSLMFACTTGTSRLAAPFEGTQWKLAHKTGSGYTDSKGRIMATNDMGAVFSSDGELQYCIAVFLMDSGMSQEQTESVIGDISGIVARGILPDMQ